MSLLLPPGYASVLLPLRHTSSARSAAVTWGAGPPTESITADEFAQRLQGDFYGAFFEALDDDVEVGPAIVRIGQDGGLPITADGYGPVTGDNDGESPPANFAVLIQKRTLLGGRQGRGRIYVPWAVPEAYVDEMGVIDANTVGLLQDCADDWMERTQDPEAPGGAYDLMLLHDEEAEVTAPTPITSLRVMSVGATQRRRMRR